MYPIISIFGKSVGSDIVFTVLGILVGLLTWFLLGKKRNFTWKNMAYGFVFVSIGWALGSRLFYGILNYTSFITLFSSDNITFQAVLKLFDGNVLLGGILMAMLFLRIYTSGFAQEKRKIAFDIFGVSVPLFYIFCKVGCFLIGCDLGIPFKFGIADADGVKRLPTALIEVYLFLLLFLLLLKFFNTEKFAGRINLNLLFWTSLFCLGTEYLKTDVKKAVYGFSPLQILSVVIFAICFFYFLFNLKYTFKNLKVKNDRKMPTNKNIFKTVFLSVLTFGFYGLVVMASISKNINKVISPYDKKKTMSFLLLFFFVGPLTFGIAYIVWYYRVTKRVANELTRRNIDYLFTKGDFWLWNIIGLMVLIGPIVYLHKLLRALNLINNEYNKEV